MRRRAVIPVGSTGREVAPTGISSDEAFGTSAVTTAGQAWFELEFDSAWPPRAWFELELDSTLGAGQGGIGSEEAFGTPTVTVAPAVAPPAPSTPRFPPRITPARRRVTRHTVRAGSRVTVASTTRVHATVRARPATVVARSRTTRAGVLARRNHVHAGVALTVASGARVHAGQSASDRLLIRTLASAVTRRDGPGLEEALLLDLL